MFTSNINYPTHRSCHFALQFLADSGNPQLQYFLKVACDNPLK